MTAEPDMENLLASIRKAIDTDIGQNTRPQGYATEQQAPLKGSMRELRIKFEDSLGRGNAAGDGIAELRSRVNRNRVADAIADPQQRFTPPPPVVQSRNGFAAILAGDMAARGQSSRPDAGAAPYYLRPTLQEPAAEIQAYDAPDLAQGADAAWGDEDQAYLPVVQGGYGDYSEAPLMSDQPALAAHDSFNQLADTLMARALGERSIEDMTQDLLRGMLKSWLDTHLPNMVERLVREEIERVARRGR